MAVRSARKGLTKETEAMTDLSNIREHMEVIGADGAHVGTVDKVEGDRIKAVGSRAYSRRNASWSSCQRFGFRRGEGGREPGC